MMGYSHFFKLDEGADIDVEGADSYCLDILETHDFSKEKKTGWSPSCTLKTLFM
jgi:hypothetical protein